MLIDIHIHTEYSPCSQLKLEDAVIRAKDLGLDGLCATDHESKGIVDMAGHLAKKYDFLIIVGLEYFTYEGDLLIFGLDEIPVRRMHAHSMIELVLRNGGISISAHPFRDYERGLGKYLKQVNGLSGVEAFNGSTGPLQNYQAYSLGMSLGLPCLGGSDAHALEELGRCVTVFPDGIANERDLIEAVRQGDVSPALYNTEQSKFEEVIWRSP